MKIKFDAAADAAYIYLKHPIAPGETSSSQEFLTLDGMTLVFDNDAKGRVIGIEILGAGQPEIINR